uniref:Uncharacterized protein n=1 Tax=viral metagenome TaxID=1070528 RepID=A0A6M3KFR6_9ZZZZ
MKLSVMERINILGLLPEKGSYSNLKLLRVAKEALSFTESENKLLNFRTEEVKGQVKTFWNDKIIYDKLTNKPVEGTIDFIMRMVNANPDNFEMRSTVGEVDIKIGEVVTNMIVKTLKDLESREVLEEKYFSIYEKFIENKDTNLKIV